MNNNKLTNLPTAGGLVILLEGVKMTFIIKKGNEEIAKSESKVVTFPNNVPYPIGTVVPSGTYTALNRNFWGDSASAQVPEFEIINSKKPDPIVEAKITVIPGSKTANITDNTDRLTSTDDHLKLYDGDGNLIVTSEGKSNTIQLTGLTASTTYNGYQLAWSNSYGETYKATVPEFKTTAEPLEPISPDHIKLITGITEVTVTYTGEEDRTGQVFHINDLTNSDGAPWTIVIDGLKGNNKYPAGTYKAHFSKDGVETASVNIPEFTTKDYVNPYDPTPSDLVVSDITETSVTITDKNSQGYNRSAEQIRISKTDSTDHYQGTIGATSITLTDLTEATEYNNVFWFHWTNPTTGKSSGNVVVPKFSTVDPNVIPAPLAEDLNVDETTVLTATVSDRNNNGYDRSNLTPIVGVSGTQVEFTGVKGETKIKFGQLQPNTRYTNQLFFFYRNDENKRVSDSIPVPPFVTKPIPTPVPTVDEITETTVTFSAGPYDEWGTDFRIRIERKGGVQVAEGIAGTQTVVLRDLTPSTTYSEGTYFMYIYSPRNNVSSATARIQDFTTRGETQPPTTPSASVVLVKGTSIDYKAANYSTFPSDYQLEILNSDNTVRDTGELGENLVTLTGLKEMTQFYTGTYKMRVHDTTHDVYSGTGNILTARTGWDTYPTIIFDGATAHYDENSQRVWLQLQGDEIDTTKYKIRAMPGNNISTTEDSFTINNSLQVYLPTKYGSKPTTLAISKASVAVTPLSILLSNSFKYNVTVVKPTEPIPVA